MSPMSNEPTDAPHRAGRSPEHWLRLMVKIIAMARIAIGVTAIARPRTARLVFAGLPADPASLAVVRTIGGRDVALGAVTLGVAGSASQLAAITGASVVSDIGDAVVLATSRRHDWRHHLAATVPAAGTAILSAACLVRIRRLAGR